MNKMLLRQAIGKKRYAVMLDDPVTFVESFDLSMWPEQKSILRDVLQRDESGKFVKPLAVFSAPRQNSKSTLISWAGLWRLFVDPSLTGDVLVVALDREGARVVFGDAVKIIKGSDILSGLLDPNWGLTRNEIRLKDGRRMLVRSAEAVRSRGLRIGCLLYDELGWAISAELWETLSAAMAAQANPLTLVASTVGPIQAGPLWRLFEAAERGDPSVRLIYYTENFSPLISSEFLEQQERNLPSFVYAREHLNQWGSASDVFATLEDWKRCTLEGDPIREADDGPCFLFADLGLVHDLTAIAIAKNTDSGVDIVHLETFQGSQDNPVQLDAVQSRIEHLGKIFNLKSVEIESHQGIFLSQKLSIPYCEITTLHPTIKSNQERWGALYTSIKNATVRLPRDRNLRKELLTLTIEERAVGWRVIDVPSIHNDRSVAVAGAVFLAEQAITKKRSVKFMAMTPQGVWKDGGIDRNQEKREREKPAWLKKRRRKKDFMHRAGLKEAYDSLSDKKKLRIRQFIALRGLLPTIKEFPGVPEEVIQELSDQEKDARWERTNA
jgi:hypothetical protein